jgi:hypothetical protein
MKDGGSIFRLNVGNHLQDWISGPIVAKNATERQTDMAGPIRCSSLALEREEHIIKTKVYRLAYCKAEDLQQIYNVYF